MKAATVLLAALTALLVVWIVYDEVVAWPLYRDMHHCQRTGKTRIDLILIYHESLKQTIPTPIVKSQWRCDGEVHRWR